MKALAPAQVREVRIHPDTGTAEVIVPDFQLSLAIGKEGQNARLAARLTGWRVDIKSETQLAEEESGGGVEYAEGEWVDERRRRARVAAGRGWRGDLGRRGGLRGAGAAGRRRAAERAAADGAAADAPAEAAGDGRRPRRRREAAGDGGAPRRRPRPPSRGARRRSAGARRAASRSRSMRRRGPTASERGASNPSAPASGAGGRRPSEEFVRHPPHPRPGVEPGAGPGRGAWLCRDHRRTASTRRCDGGRVGRALRTERSRTYDSSAVRLYERRREH